MGLAFQFELLLLVHHLSDILILNIFNAPIYVLHVKIMEDKIHGLNIFNYKCEQPNHNLFPTTL